MRRAMSEFEAKRKGYKVTALAGAVRSGTAKVINPAKTGCNPPLG